MPAERARPRALVWPIAGAVCCLAALIVCVVVGHAAWRGWLAATVLCMSLPTGAIGLVMTMRLIPGAWARNAAPFLQQEALLLPIGAAALLPVLIWMGTIFTWVGQRQDTPFRAVWLTAPFFIARAVIWIAVMAGLWRLLRRKDAPPAVSCVGLLLFLVLGTFAASDWVQSLDPAFNSSGFGLEVISFEMLTALALGLVIGLISPAPMERQGAVGGLLLTLLLFWAYLAFMPYFITWSGDVPAAAVWYLKRGRGIWAAVAILVALCRFVPMFLLLFTQVRNGRRWLLGVALALLVGSIPEAAWLTLPAAPGAPAADLWTVLTYLLALAGLGSFGWMRLRGASA
jgi:hypothetical protein